jgi:hypothetical protein
MNLKWRKCGKNGMKVKIWDRAGQLGESGVSSDGTVGERDVDIRGSKVVAPSYVNWGSFVADPCISMWLCTDCMPDLWGPVNRRSSMIIVVGRYPTIPLEMSIGIVYGPPMDSPVCGIVWKTCTRERWNPDGPYGIIAKGCHTWHVCGCAYVVLIWFIPL